MKITIKILVFLMMLSLLAAPSFAATGKPKQKTAPKTKITKKVTSAVCPVMGTKIPDVTKAAGKSVYKGKTYYFCCSMCKPMFDKNPGKYIKKQKK